jgi:hypothetical protein
MNSAHARHILKQLVDGVHPLTGEELPIDSIFNHPEVMRANLYAIHALDRDIKRTERRSLLPKHAGRAWSEDEEVKLASAFKSGVPLKQIAKEHARTLRGIASRLQHLDLITAEQGTTIPVGAVGPKQAKRSAARKRAGTKSTGS